MNLYLKTFISTALFLLSGCSSSRPVNLGLHNQQLIPCPETPNCRSSFASVTDNVHYIQPLQHQLSLTEAHAKLLKILQKLPRTKIITNNKNYIYAECTSLVFRFVDDVEFYLDDTNKVIHWRSASRVGYSDWGVNLKRLEQIRTLWSVS